MKALISSSASAPVVLMMMRSDSSSATASEMKSSSGAAASGAMDREAAGLEQLGFGSAGAPGDDRRMFEQPDQFGGLGFPNRGGARLHFGKGLGIIGETR